MTMQDRVLTALRQAGFDGRPAATLEKDGAAFALLDDTLLYLDDSGVRAVPLRDISRIHSDAQGVLRVETPGGTSVTASLVGFDPSRVQFFFNEVKAATTRAKSLPPAPQPAPPSSQSTAPGGSPWKTGWNAGGAASSAPSGAASSAAGGTVGAVGASPATPRPAPQPAPEEPRRAVISGAPTPAEQQPAPAPERQPAPGPEPKLEPKLEPKAAPIPEPSAAPRRALPAMPDVSRFTPTLRLLAVLMFLVGVGVGVLQWRADALLSGLWTAGVGAVGAFALYVFGEVVRAVAGIAARVSANE